MIEKNKKIIIFKDDLLDEKAPGELCYVKYLDLDENYAVFYKPLIAPKYFKHYLSENKIKEAYILTNDDNVNKYKDILYTFEEESGVYLSRKGIKQNKKLVLLIDKGMEIKLNLPKYFYEITNNRIIIKPYNKYKDKDYCYVCDEKEISPLLKSIMIETNEVIPGILYIGDYNLESNVKKL